MMPLRATRSRTRAARYAAAVATGPLGALSHDELGVIVDGLADPLRPQLAVALSSTCLGLRTPLQAALKVLKHRHWRVAALWYVCDDGTRLTKVRYLKKLNFAKKGLTIDDMATIGMILRWLPRLQELFLDDNPFGDAGLQALCEALDRCLLRSLTVLDLAQTFLGPAGAEALATALRLGMLPALKELCLNDNYKLGNQGVIALAEPVRKMSSLSDLSLCECGVGHEGFAVLFANLGKDDFKKLEQLDIEFNDVTDADCEALVKAIKRGLMPELAAVTVHRQTTASDEALKAVDAALSVRPKLQYEPQKDVGTVARTAEVPRFMAIKALKRFNGDVVATVMFLSSIQ